ncbi:AAA family ATPase [bacterium]|nr:AAA family ATPase [bacterium]
MNSIQNVGNVVVKNVPQPQVEQKQNNLYRVNFKADGDQFVRRGGNQTRPAILQQQPQQDPLSRMLEKQQEEQKKAKLKQNLSWGIGIASGLAIIAMVAMQLKAMKGAGGVSGVEKAMAEAQQAIPIDLSKTPKLSELVLGKELREKTDDVILRLNKAYELAARGETSGVNALLYGLPGGGKTQWTRSIAKELEIRVPGSKFYELDPTKTGSIYKDGAEKNVQGYIENFISKAKTEPNVQHTLFIDEFDTFARKSTGPDEARNEKMQNVFKRIFEAMDLPNTNIIFATNKAAKGESLTKLLDEAIMNRINEYVHVPLPNTEQMIKAMIGKFKDVDKKLVNEQLLDENNKAIKQLFDYVTDSSHNASFRDLNKITSKLNSLATHEGSLEKVLTQEELIAGINSGEIKPATVSHLKEAIIKHAEEANWHVPDSIKKLAA